MKIQEKFNLEGTIYLDSASKNLVPNLVLDRIEELINLKPARRSIYASGRETSNKYLDAKEKLADFLSVDHDLLAWMPNADYAWTILIENLIRSTENLHVMTTYFEDHNILAPLLYGSQHGRLKLELVSEDELVQKWNNRNQQNMFLLLGQTSPLLGSYRSIDKFNDAQQVIVDISRTAGQSKIDLQDWSIGGAIIDTSTSLLAPQGASFIYHPKNLPHSFPTSGNVSKVNQSFVELINNFQQYEMGMPNYPAIVAMRASLGFLTSFNFDHITTHREEIQSHLHQRMKNIPKFQPIGNSENRSSITSLKSPLNSHDVALLLDEMHNIQVRSGQVCNELGLQKLGIDDVLQISTHIYNTKDDIDQLIKALEQVSTMM